MTNPLLDYKSICSQLVDIIHLQQTLVARPSLTALEASEEESEQVEPGLSQLIKLIQCGHPQRGRAGWGV